MLKGKRPGGPGMAGALSLVAALVVGLCVAWGAGPVAAAGLIDDVAAVTLRVGERAVIGGVTGPCGRLPNRAALRGAVTRTGSIGFGGEGMRKARGCGGPTPAIEVLFTAERPGTEMLRVLGRKIGVRVTP